MLKIIYSLKPFFEDCYRRINIREYARINKISPPSASKLLKEYKKVGLLKKEKQNQYIYYFANKDNKNFIDLSRIYWRLKLEKIGIIEYFEKIYVNPVIFLFGSLSKAETNKNSDIDIAIFAISKKEINLKKYEKKIKRKIQLFVFENKKSSKNIKLLNNILNGYNLKGEF